MDRINTYNVLQKGCLSRDVLEIIGDKWTVIVLHVLQHTTMRYSAIQRAIPGVTQKVLTSTLRHLERDGIIVRTVFPVIPPHVEYKLTPLGSTLLVSLEGLVGWSEKNASLVKNARDAYEQTHT